MEKIFAKGICREKLFFIFLIASVIGAYYEQILNLIRVYSKSHIVVWEYRRGVIYGPFNVIYGFGAVVMVLLLVNKGYQWYKVVFYGGLLGGGVEYVLHFLQQTFTHTVSWDYSHKFLNIHGRTTIPYVLIWGLFSLLFVKVLYPLFSRWIEKIPFLLGRYLYKFLLIFMILDMSLSWGAIIRQSFRRYQIPPITVIGEFYDRYYPDEYLIKYFPNMRERNR